MHLHRLATWIFPPALVSTNGQLKKYLAGTSERKRRVSFRLNGAQNYGAKSFLEHHF